VEIRFEESLDLPFRIADVVVGPFIPAPVARRGFSSHLVRFAPELTRRTDHSQP